jgi:MFS family permease
MTISSFQTVFKKRPNKDRIWIILMVLVFIIPTIIEAGYGIVGFMFYRLQYKISTEMYGHLISMWFVVNFFSQMVVLPFLSKTLKFRDTTIMILGLAPALLGFFGEAFFSDIWALFVIWSVFYLLYFNIFTTTRSAMSKLMDPTEIGKAFSVLGVLEACLALVAKPFYGLLYQASLDIFAGMWILISNGILLVALIIAIALHFGMKRSQEEIERDNKMENLETKLP